MFVMARVNLMVSDVKPATGDLTVKADFIPVKQKHNAHEILSDQIGAYVVCSRGIYTI